MALPYQRLKVCGEVVFCAQGGSIHTFNIKSRALLSSWSHPSLSRKGVGNDAPSAAAQAATIPDAATAQSETAPSSEVAEAGDRPSKRVKLGAVSADAQGEADTPDARGLSAEQNGAGGQTGKGSQSGGKKKNARMVSSRPTDRPWVAVLEATSDGRHLVVVTGNDKTIWTFEHNGNGAIKELSKRTMPKRPCSVAIMPGNETIISGDKFGDVYSLPLIERGPDPSRPTAPADLRTPTPAARTPFKPQADETTVHSARNLKALASQKLHLEQQQKQQQAASDEVASQAFEHTLLLGHVSMLTSVALGSREPDGKPYILTADRDEHIRVSRGIPQAHIIESFCLGHREFVSELCVPDRRPGLLVSGGGDSDLFVWDWLRGTLLSTAALLDPVREVCPEASSVAVSRIRSLSTKEPQGETSCIVTVTCERVPAIFFFGLGSEGELRHVQTVPLAQNPLDVSVLEHDDQVGVVVSLDVAASVEDGSTTEGSQLSVVHRDESGKWVATDLLLRPDPLVDESSRPDRDCLPSPEELQAMLYSIENLRKTPADENPREAAQQEE